MAEPEIELMGINEVCAFFGGSGKPLDPNTIYRGIRAGRYPDPVRVAPNSSRWLRSECALALEKILQEREMKKK